MTQSRLDGPALQEDPGMSTGRQITIGLPDGRRLSAAEFGQAGAPFFFFHGLGGSRLSPRWMLPASLLQPGGIRLIAIDRPGFGLSSADEGLGFARYAGDAAAVADQLGINRFGVLGVSMGAAFAYACAAAHPERVTSVVILSGMGPVDGHERLRVDSKADNAFWWLARRAPWLLKPLCGLTASMTLTAARGDPAKATQRLQRTTSGPDRRTLAALLANADMLPAFLEDLRESYRQKGAGMASDLVRYCHPWGFRLEDVTQHVTLWHGTEDPKIPVELARRAAGTLPRCNARFVPGGHLAACDHLPEIIEILATSPT
jgi:pimeloyl-ACP methyl ester carboxylesterase